MTAINLNTDSLTLTIQEAGEANTNSKAGGTAGLVNTKSGLNTPIKGLTGGTNITVTEGTNEVTIGVTNDYDSIDVAPKPNNNATHALGSIDKTWSDLYLSGYSIQNANGRIEMGSTDNKAVLWEQAGNAFELDTGGADITLRTNSGNNVIIPENLVVNGSLDVNGTLTTIDTTNTAIADRIIELNRGATSNANDIGIVMERGSTGDNATIFWDESADTFRVATTTSDGTETGSMDSVTDAALSASMVTANTTGHHYGNVTGDVTGDLTGDSNGTHTGQVNGNTAGTHTGAVYGNVTGNLSGNVTGGTLSGVSFTGNIHSSNTTNAVLSTGGAIASYVGDVDGRIGETTRATGKFTSVDANGDLDAHRGDFTSGINANSTDYNSSNFMVYDNDSVNGAVSSLTMVRYLGSDGAVNAFEPRGSAIEIEIRSDATNNNSSPANIYVGGISGYSKMDDDAHQMHFYVYNNGYSAPWTRVDAFWYDKDHMTVEKRLEVLADLYTEGDAEINLQDASGSLKVHDQNSDLVFEVNEDIIKANVPIMNPNYSVANLPTTNINSGSTAYVTDESSVTNGNCMVFYDGSNWKLMHSPTTTAS